MTGGTVVRAAVEVADHRDVRGPIAPQLTVVRGEPVRLAPAQVVGRLGAGARLRLQMVDHDMDVVLPAAHGINGRVP